MLVGNTSPVSLRETYTMKAYLYLRFSSLRQKDGNSIARQLEWGKAWCQRRGVPLDDTLAIADMGRTGFSRLEKREGLATFLNACKAGRVARGSYLIVENLDRLSREHPLDAMELIRLLLKQYGVILVTIKPEYEYSAANLDIVGGILMYLELARGHGESVRKSDHATDNWERKRKNAKTAKMTRRVPSWLRCVGEGKTYTFAVIEEKAAVVKRIFEMCVKGFGALSIARKLNAEKVAPIGKCEIWIPSYVEKLLAYRGVLGECQPRRKEGDKRVAVGAVIPDYFPRIVSDDLFRAAQQARASRRTQRGLVTRNVTNLFTGLVWQGGEVMSIRPTGLKRYLQSASGAAEWVRYEPFEDAVLLWLKEASLSIGDGVDRAALERRQGDLERRIKTMTGRIAADPDLDDLLDVLSGLKKELKAVVKELEESAIPSQAHIVHTQQLVKMLADASEDERESLRRQVRQTIRHVVRRIDVEVKKAKKQAKTCTVYLTITFVDGTRRQVWYTTDQGKLYQVGVWFGGDGVANFESLRLMRPDQQQVWTVGEDVKGQRVRQIQAFRAEGLGYAEIAGRMKVGRVTIYKWLRAAGV